MRTAISLASEEIILVEQYCPAAREVQTVIITEHDLYDLCGLMWPEEQARWIAICQAEGKPWPRIEKNPQGAHKGPEGV